MFKVGDRIVNLTYKKHSNKIGDIYFTGTVIRVDEISVYTIYDDFNCDHPDIYKHSIAIASKELISLDVYNSPLFEKMEEGEE